MRVTAAVLGEGGEAHSLLGGSWRAALAMAEGMEEGVSVRVQARCCMMALRLCRLDGMGCMWACRW